MSVSSSDTSLRYERLRSLTHGRLAAAVALTVWLGTAGSALISPESWRLLATAGTIHVVAQLATLLVAARDPSSVRPLHEVTLVVDVATVAVVIAATGGTSSPAAALLVTEVVAVTLLFGRWAGVRASLLATLALAWVLVSDPPSLQLALDAVADVDPALAASLDPGGRAGVLLAVLWATTVVVGWLSEVTERDLRGRSEDLALLRDVFPDLDPRQGPDEVAQRVADVVVDRLGHDGAAVWVTDGDALRLAGHRGTLPEPDARAQLPVALGDAPPATPSPQLTPVRRGDPRPAPLRALFGARAPLLLATLSTEAEPAGLLAVKVRQRPWRETVVGVRAQRVLRMLVEQAALLLDNARLQAELADQATTDAVTGLPNHRFFQQRLGEELERVTRRREAGERAAVSLALLDLDHFKRINDTYGHPTGDLVLRAVARATAATLRGTDVVCRYGGEEFAVVLVDADADAARATCDRLRRVLHGLDLLATDGRPLDRVTASFGIATVTEPGETKPTTISRADEALYAAKQTGRDRVVHHDEVACGEGELPVGAPRP